MIILKKKYGTYSEDSTELNLALRSSLSTETPETEGCAFSLTIDCYIDLQTLLEITIGDIVYTDIDGTTPFNGGNSYWRIELIESIGTSYICQINSLGVIINFNICV